MMLLKAHARFVVVRFVVVRFVVVRFVVVALATIIFHRRLNENCRLCLNIKSIIGAPANR